jgi:hypothetical protein
MGNDYRVSSPSCLLIPDFQKKKPRSSWVILETRNKCRLKEMFLSALYLLKGRNWTSMSCAFFPKASMQSSHVLLWRWLLSIKPCRTRMYNRCRLEDKHGKCPRLAFLDCPKRSADYRYELCNTWQFDYMYNRTLIFYKGHTRTLRSGSLRQFQHHKTFTMHTMSARVVLSQTAPVQTYGLFCLFSKLEIHSARLMLFGSTLPGVLGDECINAPHRGVYFSSVTHILLPQFRN